jgi:DNA-binding MarR family transcriptional regulator
LTRLIADLDVRGLIRRRPHPTDGRQLLIEVTPQGRDLLIHDAERQNAWLATVMQARLTVTERELLGLAAALLDQLSQQEGP